MIADPFVYRKAGGHLTGVLRSVQHPGGRISVHYRDADTEILVIEVAGHNSLVESSLWGRRSWHLVLDGQAIFRAGAARWELLPEEALSLDAGTQYSIINPAPGRLRMVSVITGAGEPEREERP